MTSHLIELRQRLYNAEAEMKKAIARIDQLTSLHDLRAHGLKPADPESTKAGLYHLAVRLHNDTEPLYELVGGYTQAINGIRAEILMLERGGG